MADDEQLNDFLSQVDAVHSTVTGLLDDSVSPEEADALARRLGRDAPEADGVRIASENTGYKGLSEEERARLEAARQKGPRPGTGGGELEYAWYCRVCQLEYVEEETERCVRCGGVRRGAGEGADDVQSLQSAVERRDELREKVEMLMKRRERKEERRKRYKQWQAQRKLAEQRDGGAGTNYRAWDFWEPSSEEEEDVLPTGPQFEALERDIQERHARREERRKQAAEFRRKGNSAMKKHGKAEGAKREKHLRKAVDYYSKGIEVIRDDKTLYTNRALAHMKLGEHDKAVKDCSTALEIFEFLDSSELKRGDSATVKAFLRRAHCFRELGQFDKAREDVETLLQLDDDNDEARSLLRLIERDAQEAEKEQAQRAQQQEAFGDLDQLCAAVTEVEDKVDCVMIDRVTATVKESEANLLHFRADLNGLSLCASVLRTSVADGEASKLELVMSACRLGLACVVNEYNADLFVRAKGVQALHRVLEWTEAHAAGEHENADLELFMEVLQHESGRSEVAQTASKYVQVLRDCIVGTAHLARRKLALTSLANCSLQTRFRRTLVREGAEPLMETLMHPLSQRDTSVGMQNAIFGAFVNMFTELSLRTTFCRHTEWLAHIAKLVRTGCKFAVKRAWQLSASHVEYLEKLFATVINLSAVEEAREPLFTPRLLEAVMAAARTPNLDKLPVVRVRLVTALSRSLHVPVAQAAFLKHGGISWLLDVIPRVQDEITLITPLVRSLALVLDSASACSQAATERAGVVVELLISLLASPHEMVAGNAALCVSRLAAAPASVGLLEPTIEPIIALIKKDSVLTQKNAVVALSRLASHEPFLPKVRSLHGMDILMRLSKEVLKRSSYCIVQNT